ncbi:MAG TPA: AtpZ/AtpI family protein [Thermomicrobiaceae bacterium]|nr:AtpZ/AtpI family protein [Thermomicrobiaceae bacterium]
MVSAATGLGCSVVVSLLITVVGGVYLDRWLGTEPLFTLLGLALGLATAGYMLYELATLGQPTRRRGRQGESDGSERESQAQEE